MNFHLYYPWYQRIKINYKIAAWRLQLELSHLDDYNFRHNFEDCVPPTRSCGDDIETATHLLLHCPNHHCARKTFFQEITQVNGIISRQSNLTLTKFCYSVKFTDVYNRVYFINREIQLSFIPVNLNDSQLYHYYFTHNQWNIYILCASYFLILVSGYSERLVNIYIYIYIYTNISNWKK